MKRIKFKDERVFDIGYGRDFLVRKVVLEMYPEMLDNVLSCKYILVSRYNIPGSVYPDYIEIPFSDADDRNEDRILDYFIDNMPVVAIMAYDRDEYEVNLYGEYGLSQSFDLMVDEYFKNDYIVTEAKMRAMVMAYGGTVNENCEESSY